MCGLAGALYPSRAVVPRDMLESMLATIRHRGPDDAGIHIDGPIGLAHARLSIIDIEGGHQPMSTPDESTWITYNGEIFNYIELRNELISKGHQFRTTSDTEVILHMYQEEGERCVERLNGQWAFAIWDGPNRRLLLSRDRMGVRPLFYVESTAGFLFASEIKALFACPEVPRELDLDALDEIFTFWAPLPHRTSFRNIKALPPGHSLVFENGRARLNEYWSLNGEQSCEDSPLHEERLTEELLALLSDATRLRLRADVPVGAYLSGGLDSTLIAALAKQFAGDRLQTFSVGFDEAEFDETAYQEQASGFIGSRHRSLRCASGDIETVFADVVRHAEQPILRTAPAPLFMLSRRVREEGYKVVLTGEGADETLGGYDIFKEVKIRQFWGRQPDSRWRPLLLKRLYPYIGAIQRQPPAYLRAFFSVTPPDLDNPFFSHLPRWNLTSKLKAFLSDDARASTGSRDPVARLEGQLPASYAGWDAFRRAEYLESTLLLPGYILSAQGDKMAMAHGVEGRFPFLDHRVVEFASVLSPRLKMRVLDEKHLLKRAARGLIPEPIRSRHKQPYRAPDGCSFFGPRATLVDEMLSSDAIGAAGVFAPSPVARLVDKFRSGQATGVGDNMALVGILSTQLLIRQFRCGVAAGYL